MLPRLEGYLPGCLGTIIEVTTKSEAPTAKAISVRLKEDFIAIDHPSIANIAEFSFCGKYLVA